jgi:trehalose 6-phosphate phosphatase
MSKLPQDPVAAEAANGPPPAVFAASKICLFLDLDGTLIEFADQPRGVCVDAALIATLQMLQVALDGALALISGRRIEDLDELLRPLKFPAAGLHGLERRDAGGQFHRTELLGNELQVVRPALMEFVASQMGLLLEDKGASLAVHYRRAPHLRGLVRSVVSQVAAPLLPHYELLEGDMVLEIKPAQIDKGKAVEEFMREWPFAGRLPIYVGDDITDHEGFAAVRRYDGIAVAVGDRVTAQWHLPDPGTARAWLAQIAQEGIAIAP